MTDAGPAPAGHGTGLQATTAGTNSGASVSAHAPTQPPSAPSIPPHAPPPRLHFAAVCHELRAKVLAFLARDIPVADARLASVQRQVRASVDIIEQALARYSLDEIALSYNGGKDCLVLLIMILACLPAAPWAAPESGPDTADTADTATASQASSDSSYPPHTLARPLPAIYIVPPDPFPEVDRFVNQSTADYNLDLARYPLAMRAALDAYLVDRPAVRAIFMGTRRTDPHGALLEPFTPTDAGWPQLMRVHPVLDWHYADIWGFIRHLDIPFCELYNKGFTSLGGTSDTRPNPVLAAADAGPGDGASFRPAYELLDDDEERLGRVR